MLRNRVLTVLQKTYDDSYLSCSTAVYYESQGDEIEAMRHWRGALEQIYEYHATKAPPAYTPQTDTEKALHEALRELEMQCKERIDLLEALRASRQDDSIEAPSSNKLSKAPESPAPELPPRGKGSIGQGTIPAVTYSELSRPSRPPMPYRPSLPTRTSSENAVVGGGPSSGANASARFNPAPPTSTTPKPGSSSKTSTSEKPEKPTRSASPEKHTMRTTLRPGKGEKPAKASRKPPKPTTEGSSKAATLAWTALGSRERFHHPLPPTPDNGSAAPGSSRRQSSEQPRKFGSSGLQWDSHSRRLVPPRENEPSTNGAQASTAPRHSDEYPYSRPSLLSVSAASSALNSSSFQDLQTAESSPSRTGRNATSRNVPGQIAPGETVATERQDHEVGTADDSGEASGKRNVSDAPVKRKPAPRYSSGVSRQPKVEKERPPAPRRRERSKAKLYQASSSSENDIAPATGKPKRGRGKEEGTSKADLLKADLSEADSQDDSSEGAPGGESSGDQAWKKRKAAILRNLPTGVDESAAKQILNDIVVQGDEVRWGDIAGLEIAKNALRETVVYPFLRPDLFMGLREPARGMLLFGPPGTGKTMLARAVATESNSTFFSISASSLTSKFLGESEKLVRALFGLARALAPSIIFVDEIDSLLTQRSGSGEHEATRRIKTEFLIQWSDLQRAAAGRETTEKDKERGDANRVLVLAATNLPWAIDEAARRRFVRRQYIPLPERTTRETQLRTLLGQQKHNLSAEDINRLVDLTEGFSGSDITALAKDAAMGPLRSLGEALLHMTMEDIRPIMLIDFEASLGTIRPSVSKAGLKEYEDWAKEFGERGG